MNITYQPGDQVLYDGKQLRVISIKGQQLTLRRTSGSPEFGYAEQWTADASEITLIRAASPASKAIAKL